MFYNLLNYSNDGISNAKTPNLKTVLDAVAPDLFMVCELVTESGSNYMFNNAIDTHNSDFEKATFAINSSGSNALQQMVYYNGKKLILESQRVIGADTRDINHYTFKLNTENANTNPIRLEVFITHLKASRGFSNRQRRLNSIEDFVGALDEIPSSSYVLFAGDFNFYTSNEEGYIRLLSDQNPIEIIDPINRPCPPFPNDGINYFDENFYDNTYFWNNSTFADVHTQSTRTFNSGLIDQSGAGGGMDDRFDFIMMSKNFTTSSNLYYVNNSYKAIGNNGNCYNSWVADSSCSGTYSLTLRNALLEFSDHLPVVMEIETPENTLSNTSVAAQLLLPKGNIANQNLTVSIPSRLAQGITELIVYDMKGRKVSQKKVESLQTNLTIDTRSLSAGIYYLSTNLGNKPIAFVKQ